MLIAKGCWRDSNTSLMVLHWMKWPNKDPVLQQSSSVHWWATLLTKACYTHILSQYGCCHTNGAAPSLPVRDEIPRIFSFIRKNPWYLLTFTASVSYFQCQTFDFMTLSFYRTFKLFRTQLVYRTAICYQVLWRYFPHIWCRNVCGNIGCCLWKVESFTKELWT